jgi:hypothetical protein
MGSPLVAYRSKRRSRRLCGDPGHVLGRREAKLEANNLTSILLPHVWKVAISVLLSLKLSELPMVPGSVTREKPNMKITTPNTSMTVKTPDTRNLKMNHHIQRPSSRSANHHSTSPHHRHRHPSLSCPQANKEPRPTTTTTNKAPFSPHKHRKSQPSRENPLAVRRSVASTRDRVLQNERRRCTRHIDQ